MHQKLLEKFFHGTCSPEECAEVLAWYQSGEAEQELTEKIKAYWQEEHKKKNDPWGRDAIFASICQEISASDQEDKILCITTKSDTHKSWKKLHYAATLTLLLVSAGWIYFQFFHSSVQALAQLPPAKSQLQDSIIVKRTSKGEKLKFILQDGTTVLLNSASQLSYRRNSAREVLLLGEAFFEVAKDSLHPFKIHSGAITTTVLGTSFNVKAFENEEEVAISVVSGEVKVQQQNPVSKQEVHLIPGEQAIYQAKDTVLIKKEFDDQDVLSWKEGRLYFKNASFSEILSSLERWYGVEIEVQRKGIEDGFSGSYTNRSLESVLEGMSFVLNFEYEIQEKKLIIK